MFKQESRSAGTSEKIRFLMSLVLKHKSRSAAASGTMGPHYQYIHIIVDAPAKENLSFIRHSRQKIQRTPHDC